MYAVAALSGNAARIAGRRCALATQSSGEGGAYRRGGEDDGIKRRGSERQRRDGTKRSSSNKGAQFEGTKRRRGRPAWQRSPDDTPLRDGNRDRLLGLLTERAAKTLVYYFTELNPTLMQWLEYYLKENPIPRDGNWDDVSGENFLRKLLSMPVTEAKWDFYGRDAMFACSAPLGVDPRNIAQRIMEIRHQIAKEWIDEMGQVGEENAILMRETAMASLEKMADNVVLDPSQMKGAHPEMLHPDFVGFPDVDPDDSAIGDDD